MKENSRIRFNPVTKEIEVEGSEKFVRTYFQKLQQLLSQGPGEKTSKQLQKKARPVKKAKRAKAAPGRKKAAKETQADAVVALVSGSEGGITTSALKEKTGLTERQIWSVVYRAQKQGKIKKTKRGMYTAA
jgi:predicted Rossmann fold nucleotide-binding protein DprA/Smf involved in DNA uptake